MNFKTVKSMHLAVAYILNTCTRHESVSLRFAFPVTKIYIPFSLEFIFLSITHYLWSYIQHSCWTHKHNPGLLQRKFCHPNRGNEDIAPYPTFPSAAHSTLLPYRPMWTIFGERMVKKQRISSFSCKIFAPKGFITGHIKSSIITSFLHHIIPVLQPLSLVGTGMGHILFLFSVFTCFISG